jgi:hypothetical protein
MWTVILHFDRGVSQIHKDLTAHQAQHLMQVVVFHNRDCVNANVFMQKQEDPRDEPDYPTE